MQKERWKEVHARQSRILINSSLKYRRKDRQKISEAKWVITAWLQNGDRVEPGFFFFFFNFFIHGT